MTQPDETSLHNEYDVVVIGAGLAGLVAANAAVDGGASVLLLEKLAIAGGSLTLSTGRFWHSYARRGEIPGWVDSRLVGMISGDFESAMSWMREHGVRLATCEGPTGGYQIEPDPVSGGVAPLLDRFKSAGGTALFGAAVTALELSASGEVVGVRLKSPLHHVLARAIVLAAGGFQGDPELVTRYIAPWERLFWRSNPGTTGDGFRMGLSVGVGATAGLGSFYGHLSPHQSTRAAKVEPEVFQRATLNCIEHVVLLNLSGKRFIDENRHTIPVANALAHDERGIGIAVFDSLVHEQYVTQHNARPGDERSALVLWEKVGGRVAQADTLPELFEKLVDTGIAVGVATDTMAEYDLAAAQRSDRALPVPRRANLHRCSTSPFFAMLVCPAITYTEGGLRTNESCEALDNDGDSISGLYVAGEVAGTVSLASQAGGLATAVITGLRAGASAADSIHSVANQFGG